MKFALRLVPVLVVALFMTSCETLGVQPQTFNEGVAACLSDATSTRSLAGSLLDSKAITADDAENVNKQADVLREGCDVADQLKTSDLSTAQGKLDATRNALTALRKYLEGKK